MEKTIRDDGFSLYAAECGQGFPLVLLHGNGESGDTFEAQMRYFSARFRVIAVDTRGHGRSPRGNGAFTPARFADDLKDFLDARGLTAVFLLGFSDGGNIALLFTLKYPAYVKKLVLNGANLYPSGLRLSFLLGLYPGYAAAALAAPFSRKAAARKELLGLMALHPHIRPAALGGIRIPVLVLTGTHDLIRDSHSRLIADSLPDARLLRIPGGHSVVTENSEAYNRAVADFLGVSAAGEAPQSEA